MSDKDEEPASTGIDRDAACRNGRLTALFIAAIVVLGGGAGLALGLLRTRHGGHHHASQATGVLIYLVVLAVLLAVALPLIFRLYRKPNYAQVLQFGLGQRRRVGKALRKGRPIAPSDRPAADALVQTMRRQWWQPYPFGVLVLIYAAQALFDHGFQRGIAIILVALYAVLVPFMLWQRRTILANYDRLEPTPHSSAPTS